MSPIARCAGLDFRVNSNDTLIRVLSSDDLQHFL